MTTRTFTLNVTSPQPALATAAAALSSGQWAVFPMNGITNANWAHSSNNYLDGCPIGQYDPFNDRMVFIGGEHPTGPSTHAQLNAPLSTNTWTQDPLEPANTPDSALTQPEHGYYHMACDWTNGDLYWLHAGGDQTVYYRAGGTAAAWTTVANTPIPRSPSGGSGYAMAQVFHPKLFNGRGGIVHAGVDKIAIYNPLTNSWAMNAGTFPMGSLHVTGVYNRADQCVYVGGGNSSGTYFLSMYRIDANGTVTQRANFPIATGANFNSTEGPLLPCTGTNKMVVMSTNQQNLAKIMYEYDHVSNTWSSIGSYPFTYGAGFAGIAVDSCNCMVFIYDIAASQMNPSAYIWKR